MLYCFKCKKISNCNCKNCLHFYVCTINKVFAKACVEHVIKCGGRIECVRDGLNGCFIEIDWVDEIKYKKFLGLREKLKDLNYGKNAM